MALFLRIVHKTTEIVHSIGRYIPEKKRLLSVKSSMLNTPKRQQKGAKRQSFVVDITRISIEGKNPIHKKVKIRDDIDTFLRYRYVKR